MTSHKGAKFIVERKENYIQIVFFDDEYNKLVGVDIDAPYATSMAAAIMNRVREIENAPLEDNKSSPTVKV